MSRSVIAGLGASGLFLACSAAEVGSMRPLGDGRYQVVCETSLRECLAEAESRCDTSGYHVLEADEAKRRVGVPPVQSVFADSRAIFACGDKKGLLNASPIPENSARTAPAAAPLESCLPGASRACVGPAGCSGGQQCLPDGRGLSACDCGPPAAVEQPRSGTSPQELNPVPR